jgi:hypothetical protein
MGRVIQIWNLKLCLGSVCMINRTKKGSIVPFIRQTELWTPSWFQIQPEPVHLAPWLEISVYQRKPAGTRPYRSTTTTNRCPSGLTS